MSSFIVSSNFMSSTKPLLAMILGVGVGDGVVFGVVSKEMFVFSGSISDFAVVVEVWQEKLNIRIKAVGKIRQIRIFLSSCSCFFKKSMIHFSVSEIGTLLNWMKTSRM